MGKPAKVTKYVVDGNSLNNTIDGTTYSADIQSRGMLINGNDGNDVLKGGSGQDVLTGGNGNDTLIADLSDLIGAGDGTTVYDGGSGSDTLDLSGIANAPSTGLWIQAANGAKGFNFIRTDVTYHHGSLNIDPVNYSSTYGNNFKNIENFILGDGNDVIQLLTPTGDNRIEGRGGDDHILAGDGNDVVDGGTGNDLISGGWGNDVLTGGDGNDAFVFQGRVTGQYTYDTITDFNTAADQVWLYGTWTIDWDQNSPNTLHAYLRDNGAVFGEVTFQGLTLADAALIQVQHIDPNTGDPFGGP